MVSCCFSFSLFFCRKKDFELIDDNLIFALLKYHCYWIFQSAQYQKYLFIWHVFKCFFIFLDFFFFWETYQTNSNDNWNSFMSFANNSQKVLKQFQDGKFCGEVKSRSCGRKLWGKKKENCQNKKFVNDLKKNLFSSNKNRDSLKELEERKQSNKICCLKWMMKQNLQMKREIKMEKTERKINNSKQIL